MPIPDTCPHKNDPEKKKMPIPDTCPRKNDPGRTKNATRHFGADEVIRVGGRYREFD